MTGPIACARSGCTGSIVDGYCDTCGLAPAKASAVAESGPQSARVDVSRLTTRSSSTSTTARRSRVGAGVVDITPMGAADPAAAVMADPSVPEDRRFCTRCDSAVGRSRDGRQGRQSGFCPNCGSRFDFGAKLGAGDLVAGQYEVAGALAHGGLGWIYLVCDRNVSGRWCVLKGLLDTEDPDAAEAAVAERRFLAEVAHPAIVEIYNFVNHAGQGYIVMEYVGGPSLKQLAKRRRQEGGGPMPATEAAAYLLAVLPALAYLHDRGLVYCDFKPDNVIHVGDSVKLIDLGGVRRRDDPDAAIFGTAGYQAPEVPDTGPSIASDLYTVGRALAVLILDWPSWQRADHDRLPPRDKHPVLVDHDCLWRFLQRACAPDATHRFTSADEMADSLYGVLCQVAAASDGTSRPRTSTRFTPPRPRLGPLDWQTLPSPLLPNHPRVANRVAGVADGDPPAVIALARSGARVDVPGDVSGGFQSGMVLSWADVAAVVRAYLELGDLVDGHAALAGLDPAGPDAGGFEAVLDTARAYLAGILYLAAGQTAEAVRWLDAAYAATPGEAASTLAYAAALEATGDPTRLEEAADLYEQVAVADPSWVTAVAGLARTLARLDRAADAARVLVAVPESHPTRPEALTMACRAMEQGHWEGGVAAAAGDRVRASTRGARSASDAELAVALFRAALASLARKENVGANVAGRTASVPELSRAAEAALLDLADATPDRARRHELLDAAARTRPWSLW